MKILRKVFVFVLAALIGGGGLLFAGGKSESAPASGGGSAPASASAPAAKIKVTFAGTEAATSEQSLMMQETADLLNASGRFDADVQVAGALSADTDNLVTQAKTGVPLVVPSDPTRLASQFKIPELSILMAPYILTDPAVLQKLPETALFKEWQTQLEAQGITFVANMYNGFRSFYTTTPVKTVADLKNLRIRGFGNPTGNALAKYLGFANIGIPWGEVLPGIQQKTLDGCEVQVATAYTSAIYEVAKHLALTKHYLLQSSFVCSTKLLTSMPQADRDFFIKTIRDMAQKYGVIIAGKEDGYYQQMRDKGVTITEINLKEFQDAIAPLYINNDLQFSPGLKDRLFKELGL
ncbi:MAG: TRAP transporter substrate-binding protein DctP [Spirochaetaceae bacterium]|jgi:TRAP-type C4-dicarboxylate transport system substrate-binding protein|nr:TRAP transporter substrate-binding protein DctP [Spirochaetaceae bacterium]